MSLRRLRQRGISTCRCALVLALVLTAHRNLRAQEHVYPKPDTPTPTEILSEIWVLAEPVVTVQWPATLELVNAPANTMRLEPGQCVRFAVIARGDDRDRLLRGAQYQFTVESGGDKLAFPAEPAQAVKQIKPEGGDMVTGVLKAVGIKNPFSSMASMAASRARWCMAENAKDATANIAGSATTADGKRISLKSRSLDLATFETARAKPAFTNMDTLGPWVQGYYASPDPAQILPALRIVASDKEARTMLNVMQFFLTALQGSPAAAEELKRRLPGETIEVKIYSLPLLQQAGYSGEAFLASFKEEDREVPRPPRLPDPFDLTPDQTLFQKMDMLWSVFLAAGEIKPVRTIASMLAWQDDYVRVAQAREAHQKNPQLKTELSDSLVRGVVYAAAGWSLGSLSKQSGLVADYLDVIKQSPDFPAEAEQLDNLYSNSAFRMK